ARHHRLGFFGRFSHHFVSLRDAHNFFDGCSALGDTAPAVLPQSLHTFGNSTLLELAAIAFLHDQLSHRLRDQANFIDRHSTLIAVVPTLITAGATSEAGTDFFHWKTDLREIFMWIVNYLHAVRTNRAHEPLRDEGFHH